MKNMKLIALLLCLSVIVCSFAGCAKTAPIVFELNGGVLPEDALAEYEYSTDKELVLPTPTKQYYKFEGWSLSSDGADILKDGKLPAEMELTDEQIKDGIKVYAIWTRLTGKISYELNGGDWAGKAGVDAYNYGSSTNLPTNVEREHFEFEGWLLDGEEVDKLTVSQTGDVSLKASWVQVKTKINFVLLNDDAVPPDADKLFETEDGIDDLTDEEYIPEAPGFRFVGWYLSEADAKDPNTEAVAVTKIDPDTTEEVTLYAKWIETPVLEDENNNWLDPNN